MRNKEREKGRGAGEARRKEDMKKCRGVGIKREGRREGERKGRKKERGRGRGGGGVNRGRGGGGLRN